MPRLLVVHHTTSPALQAMLEAALAGARDPELDTVDTVQLPALAANVPDVLAADGFLLGTPANIGYMSGALKRFFDQIYYPCLHAKKGAPFGLYVHGNSDTGGAVRAVASITTGLGWAVGRGGTEQTGRGHGPRHHRRRASVLRAGRDRRREPPVRRSASGLYS